MTAEAEPAMIPMNEVRPNPMGMVIAWGHKAALGVLAKRAKSGSLTWDPLISKRPGSPVPAVTYNERGKIRHCGHDAGNDTPSENGT